MVDLERVFGKVFEVLSGEGGFFTPGRSCVKDDSFNLVGLSFFDEESRGEALENREEGFGEGIEVFREFRKEGLESLKDLSFSFSEVLGERLDGSGEDFSVFRERRGFKEIRIFESKEGKSKSIFGIGLSGGGSIRAQPTYWELRDRLPLIRKLCIPII